MRCTICGEQVPGTRRPFIVWLLDVLTLTDVRVQHGPCQMGQKWTPEWQAYIDAMCRAAVPEGGNDRE